MSAEMILGSRAKAPKKAVAAKGRAPARGATKTVAKRATTPVRGGSKVAVKKAAPKISGAGSGGFTGRAKTNPDSDTPSGRWDKAFANKAAFLGGYKDYSNKPLNQRLSALKAEQEAERATEPQGLDTWWRTIPAKAGLEPFDNEVIKTRR